MKIIPFAVDYWKTIADEVFVLDNNSTDGSAEYLEKIPNVHVIRFSTDGFNDAVHKGLKNEVWKSSRGKADFVVVCDLDEFMYSEEGIRGVLQKMKTGGFTICKPRGYDMVSKTFPQKDDRLLWEQCGMGVPDSSFNKVTIFNPNEIDEIRYGPGAHHCSPTGNVKWYDGNDVLLLHYKHLSLDYVLNRYREYDARMSKINREKKWGVQYSYPETKIVNIFNNKLNASEQII